MFTILDPLEKYKFEEYINKGKSSLHKIGLITIKFKYNLCVDVNVVFRKTNYNVFDVISNFDISLICKGYDIKTGKTLDLSEYNGDKVGTWNKWNKSYYQPDIWDTKRLMRQFSRVAKYEERGYDLISVTDKGIGIPPEMQDELFDIFGGARRKGTAGERSFGLGLFISKQIIEAHHGKIRMVSEPGNGSVFYVELPVL